MKTEIEQFAKQVARLLRHEDRLMTEQEVAEFLRVPARTFNTFIKPHPKFPRPIKLPTTRGHKSTTHARWWMSEIHSFAEDCKEL